MHIDSIDLSQYSIEDLETLVQRAQTTIRQLKAKRASELRRQVELEASALGISVAELMGLEKPARSKRTTGGKITPKYRNPANPEQTWTGRGQKPVWLREKIEQGAKLEDFLIS